MAAKTKTWGVTYHQLAKRELLDLKRNHPCAFRALCNTMDELAKQANPMKPDCPQLDVQRIRYDAPGWFRIKVLGHTQWRVIFRLIQDHGGQPLEVQYDCFLDPNARKKAIQITKVAHRSTVYQKLRPRQDKVYGLL